jgi:hypothetical protein
MVYGPKFFRILIYGWTGWTGWTALFPEFLSVVYCWFYQSLQPVQPSKRWLQSSIQKKREKDTARALEELDSYHPV